MWFPPVTPRINQDSSLDRLTLQSPHTHTKRTINKELKANTQQRDGVAQSTPEKGGGVRS
jgi:hypothetical protein